MAHVSLLSDPASPANQYGVETWQRALRLWRLPCRVVAPADLSALRFPSCSVLVIEEAPRLTQPAVAGVDRLVSEGAGLILSGEVPPALLRLAGVTAVPREASNRYRCLRVAADHPLLDRFIPEEVLFCTCSVFNALSPGRDFEVSAERGTPVAASQRLTLADPLAEGWAESAADGEPSLVVHRPFPGSGRVVYSPLPLGSLTRLKTPTVLGVSELPYRVENHGVLLLMAGLARRLALWSGRPPAELCLWPRGAAAAAALSGDVHEYFRYPNLRARREYTYLDRMAALLRARGLNGKYTFAVTARVAEQHPDALRRVAHYDIVPHTFDDIALADLSRTEQRTDIERCIETFAAVIPDTRTYRLGWRSHSYASDAVTREVLAEAGYLWISDMGASWYGEWDFKRWPARHTTYVVYPQQARGTQGQALPLWEMPECAPSDFALYESKRRHPEADWAVLYTPDEALRVWSDRLQAACRREELFVLNWHPFLTLSEPDRAHAAERMLDLMRQAPGAAFMTISEAAQWWDARDKVEVEHPDSDDGPVVRIRNGSDRRLEGLAVRVPGKVAASRTDRGPLEVAPRAEDTLIILDLDPGAASEITIGEA